MSRQWPLMAPMLLCAATLTMAQEDAPVLVIDTSDMAVALDARGWVVGLHDSVNDREIMPEGRSCPLLTLTIDDEACESVSVEAPENAGQLILSYDLAGVNAVVEFGAAATHLWFRLTAIEGASPTEIRWGPFFTTVGDSVGEIIAVSRDDVFAIGLQGLNVQTIGAASGFEGGSMLTAYAREHDGGVVGSAIALFGAPVEDALTRIGEIEVAEGLPHPMLDGEWGKVSKTAKLAYLISPFGEANMEAVLDRAEQAGLRYIYHPGPFTTWGHFQLNAGEFPEGDESMRRCVEAAEARGIRLGVHTLTAFITTNDPYITPVPDPRLARMGSSVLNAAVDAEADELAVADGAVFTDRGTLGAAIIGEEIIQYESVTETEPWALTGCRRGAFGTQAMAHGAGADIGKLADHAYRTLYPGIENGMADELAARLVELFNNTGLRQISFDGLEGLSTYGYGEYSRNDFVRQCYDGWEQEVISDASNLLHYLWHAHTRMNWGEPWGHATREGMPEYRFANQALFDRNLFPRMLGWFQLRLDGGGVPATSLSDVEWVLSKAAGFDAGFALVSSVGEMAANGQTDAILAAVNTWETARLAGAFSADQRARLQESAVEWRLAADGGDAWLLSPISAVTCTFPDAALQPGQPVTSTWDVVNPFEAQPLTFTLRVAPDASAGSVLENPTIAVGLKEVTVHTRVEPGQYLICDGSRTAQRCDANSNTLETIDLGMIPPDMVAGRQQVTFTSQSLGAMPPAVDFTFRFTGPTEPVGPAR